MKQHKKLLINLVFAAVILAAAAVLLLVRKANQTGAPLCAELIYGDSNTRLTFPLEKDADYDVDTGYLTVHIKIQDGAARFVDSPCPALTTSASPSAGSARKTRRPPACPPGLC